MKRQNTNQNNPQSIPCEIIIKKSYSLTDKEEIIKDKLVTVHFQSSQLLFLPTRHLVFDVNNEHSNISFY